MCSSDLFAWRDEAEYQVTAEEAEAIDRDRREAKARLLDIPMERPA